MLSSLKSVDWSQLPRRHPVWTTMAALFLALIVLLILFDWNWLRRPVERIVSRTTGREFRIHGDLDVDFFPLEVHAGKLYLSNASWSKEPAMARVGQDREVWGDGQPVAMTAVFDRVHGRAP